MKNKRILLVTVGALLLNLSLFSQSVGEPAPDFTVDLEEGGSFTLSQQTGKVVLVFFFGNGCSFCISAGPSVEGLFQEHQANPDFVAVGLDTWNSSSNNVTVAGFAASAEVTFPLAIKAGSVASDYGTTYDRLAVIDQEGILSHKGSSAALNDINNARGVIEGLFSATSIDPEMERNTDIAVYPNPAADEVRFSFFTEATGTAWITMFDIAGNEVQKHYFNHKVGEQEFSLDISALQGGVYLYRVFHEGKAITGKLILQ